MKSEPEINPLRDGPLIRGEKRKREKNQNTICTGGKKNDHKRREVREMSFKTQKGTRRPGSCCQWRWCEWGIDLPGRRWGSKWKAAFAEVIGAWIILTATLNRFKSYDFYILFSLPPHLHLHQMNSPARGPTQSTPLLPPSADMICAVCMKCKQNSWLKKKR